MGEPGRDHRLANGGAQGTDERAGLRAVCREQCLASSRLRATSADVGVNGTSAAALNTWTHLALTFDGATLRMFVNGMQIGTQSAAGAAIVTTGALRIGGNSVWGEYFKGLIDEVRVYNRALSAAEIQTDMATPIP